MLIGEIHDIIQSSSCSQSSQTGHEAFVESHVLKHILLMVNEVGSIYRIIMTIPSKYVPQCYFPVASSRREPVRIALVKGNGMQFV